MKGYFVTGTDTGVGKTQAACALLHRLTREGKRCAGMKPVAAGCISVGGAWRNDDALQLLARGNVELSYEDVNPAALPAGIAPHLAAEEAGLTLSVDHLHAAYRRLAARADCVVVEGAGGWKVPLNERETLSDLAACIGLPVILVVGMRLGCLNHALLTADAIARSGLHLAGWVANCIEPAMPSLASNIATLEQRLAAPLIATFPHLPSAKPEERADLLNLEALLDT